jgi:hypothetical protein
MLMRIPSSTEVLKTIVKYKYFLVILAVAAILRLIRFQEFTQFGHDSSRDSIVEYKMFTLGEIIYRGPVFSVVWGDMSPIFYYLIAPFHFILNFHPLASSIFSGVLNFLCIVFASFISYKFFGKKVALVTAFVFGISTIYIVNASSALNPSFMPIFVLGLYYFLAQLLIEKKQAALIGISFCMSFILSLHMSGFFFIPLLVLLYIIVKPKIDKKTFLISAVVFGIFCVLPYLIQEKKLAWFTIKQFIIYFESSDKRPHITIIKRIWNFTDAVLKNTSWFLFGTIVKNYILYTVPVYLYLIYQFITSARNFRKLTAETLLVAILVIYIVTFFVSVPFGEGALNRLWFGAAYIPLLGIYFSLAVSKLVNKKYYYLGILILAIFAVVNINYIYNFGGSSDSYSNRKELAEFLRKDSNGQDFDIYGSNPEPLYYILWYFEKDDKRKRPIQKLVCMDKEPW